MFLTKFPKKLRKKTIFKTTKNKSAYTTAKRLDFYMELNVIQSREGSCQTYPRYETFSQKCIICFHKKCSFGFFVGKYIIFVSENNHNNTLPEIPNR